MSSDMFMKNLGGRGFTKHTKTFCGADAYDNSNEVADRNR